MHLRGLEPRTHWLRVSCSTNWAKGAFPSKGLSTQWTFPWSPLKTKQDTSNTTITLRTFVVQALGLLVSVSWIHYCTYTSDLSTRSLRVTLPALAVGYLILRWASRLDAFSVYPIRTRLLSYAIGMTTDAPVVRPTWSSRTRVSSSQISCAHDR